MPTLELIPYQNEVLQDDIHALLMHGGLGSGKSRTLVMDLYNQCKEFAGAKFALTCNDYSQLKDSTHVEFAEFLDGIGCRYRYLKSDKLIIFPNGSEVHYLTLDKAVTALKGPQWDAVYFDEADGNETTQEKFDYLCNRSRGKRRFRNGQPFLGHRIRAACNPVAPAHFLAHEFASSFARSDHRIVEVTTYDNAANLPADYIEKLEAKYKPGTTGHKRWMLGKIIALEGAVYGAFDTLRHIIDALPKLSGVTIHGLDLGSKDPSVLEVIGLDDGGRMYVIDEWVSVEYTPVQRQAVQLLPHIQNELVFSDHSLTMRLAFEEAGIKTVKADKDVQAGIQSVNTRFEQNALFLLRGKCPYLEQCLQLQVYKEASTKNEPHHAWSHANDALRYAVHTFDSREAWLEM